MPKLMSVYNSDVIYLFTSTTHTYIYTQTNYGKLIISSYADRNCHAYFNNAYYIDCSTRVYSNMN